MTRSSPVPIEEIQTILDAIELPEEINNSSSPAVSSSPSPPRYPPWKVPLSHVFKVLNVKPCETDPTTVPLSLLRGGATIKLTPASKHSPITTTPSSKLNTLNNPEFRYIFPTKELNEEADKKKRKRVEHARRERSAALLNEQNTKAKTGRGAFNWFDSCDADDEESPQPAKRHRQSPPESMVKIPRRNPRPLLWPGYGSIVRVEAKDEIAPVVELSPVRRQLDPSTWDGRMLLYCVEVPVLTEKAKSRYRHRIESGYEKVEKMVAVEVEGLPKEVRDQYVDYSQ